MANRKHHHHHDSHDGVNSNRKPKRHRSIRKKEKTQECTRAMTVFEQVNAPVRPAVTKETKNVKIKKDMMLLEVESKHTAKSGSNERISAKEKAATATGREHSSKERIGGKKEKTSSKERIAIGKQATSRDAKSRERVRTDRPHHSPHPIPKQLGSAEFVGTGKVQQTQKKRNLTKQSEDGLGPLPLPRNRMTVSTPPIAEPVNPKNSGKMKSKTGSSSEDTSKIDMMQKQEKQDKRDKEERAEREAQDHAKSPLELVAEIPDDACLTAHQPIDKVRYKMVCYNGVRRYEVDTTYVPPPDNDEKSDDNKLNIYSPPTSPTPPTSPNVNSPVQQQAPPVAPPTGSSVPVFPVRYKAVLVNGIRRFVPDLESGPVGSAPPTVPAKPIGSNKPPSETAIPPGYNPSSKPPSVPASPLPGGSNQPYAAALAQLVATTPPTTPQREKISPRNVSEIKYRMIIVNGVKRYEPIKD